MFKATLSEQQHKRCVSVCENIADKGKRKNENKPKAIFNKFFFSEKEKKNCLAGVHRHCVCGGGGSGVHRHSVGRVLPLSEKGRWF